MASSALGALTLAQDLLGSTATLTDASPPAAAPYLSHGVFYLGAADGSGPLLDVGNSTELQITHQFDPRPLANYKTGGQLSNKGRLAGVSLSWRVMDRNLPNLQRAIQATVTQAPAYSVSNEPHTAHPGGFIALEGLPDRSQPITVTLGGNPTAAGSDWVAKPGGLYIPNTTSLPAASPVQVSYQRLPTAQVEAFEDTVQRQFRAVYSGINEADGKDTSISIPRLTFDPTDILTLIDDDAQGIAQKGQALAWTTRPIGRSAFYTVLNDTT